MSHVYRCHQRTEEGVRFLRSGVTGSCKLFTWGVGNQILLLWKITESSLRLQSALAPPQNAHSYLKFYL